MSLQSSYWAGFIAADGNISQPPENSIKIQLSVKDDVLLHRFKKHIDWTGEVKYQQSSGFTRGPMCSIKVCGVPEYIEILEEIYSVTPAKTFTIKSPNVEGENKLAYLVGLIDGDGSIGFYNGDIRKPRVSIATASRTLAEWLSCELGLLGERADGAVIQSSNNRLHVVNLTSCYARTALYKLQSIPVEKLSRKWDHDFYLAEEDVRLPGAHIHIDTAREIKGSWTGVRGDVLKLANRYGISKNIVYGIVSGKTWKCLDNE